jgi:hypothetical protein
MSVDDILEKFAILSYVVDNDWLGHWVMGGNIWEKTIFHEFFIKKLGPDYKDTVDQKFLYHEDKYRTKFNEAFNKMIEQITVFQKDIHLDTNPKMPHNQSDGHYDFSLPKRTRWHKKKMTYFNDEVRPVENPEIKCDHMSTLKDMGLLRQIYAKKLAENVSLKMAQGIDQTNILNAVSNFNKDQYSYSDLLTLKEALIETNSQIGLIKFPKAFKNDLKMMIHYHKKNELLKLEAMRQDPNHRHAADEIAWINQNTPGQAPIYEVSKAMMEDYMLDQSSLTVDQRVEIDSVLGTNPYIWTDSKRMSYKLGKTKDDVEMSQIIIKRGEGEEPDFDEEYLKMSPEALRAQGIKIWNAGEIKFDDDGTIQNEKDLMKDQVGMPPEELKEVAD